MTKIGARDHQGLRKFFDFLSSIETARQMIQGLNILNDYFENQKLLTKLPDWLISWWNRKANKYLRDEKTYPNFKTFVSSITAEADLQLGWNTFPLCPPMLITMTCYMTKIGSLNIEGGGRATDSGR